ncbi:MAG: 4-hydroxy-tetrahydrodipicolinate synthase [Nannocystaceae bacterium]|nr:4-hydroxy-tetrahydrodipicolinate synthase [Myxococcales bacterium]
MTESTRPLFSGAFTALVTPMKQGDAGAPKVDDDALARLVERQIAGGIDGLVPVGTTGESATLSPREHVHVVKLVTEVARGRVPILAGAGANNTAEAIELTRACAELGVAGTLHVTPYYNKPTQEGLVAHFTAIADAVDLPIVLYNVPSRTSCDMAPETVATLARHRNIVGIKEATGDMHKAARIRELCPPPFAVLSGDDFSLLPFLSLGCDGVISVVSNVIPGELARLCAAARDGRMDEARALHFRQLALSRALFTVVNPIPVKAALAMLGLCGPAIRLPLVPLDPASAHGRAVAEALRTLAIEA